MTEEDEKMIFMESIALNGFSLAGISFMQGLGRPGASIAHLLLLLAVLNFVFSNYIPKICFYYSKRGVKTG